MGANHTPTPAPKTREARTAWFIAKLAELIASIDLSDDVLRVVYRTITRNLGSEEEFLAEWKTNLIVLIELAKVTGKIGSFLDEADPVINPPPALKPITAREELEIQISLMEEEVKLKELRKRLKELERQARTE